MAETIYGTQTEEGHVMSEKVQTLAQSVYKEFEKVINRYDEDVVKELMPLVVGILESLDGACVEKQELDVEIELLREDNDQLLNQYEREKQLRKTAEQKYLEMEDAVVGEKKDQEEKVESLESIVRMLELKSKNSADHVSRLEEKEAEMKKEYSKLHERYTELFKTHMDYMERTKILMGTDKIAELTGTLPRVKGGYSMPALRPVSMGPGVVYQPQDSQHAEGSERSLAPPSPQGSRDLNVSLKSELADSSTTSEKGQLTDSVAVREQATGTRELTESTTPPSTQTPITSSPPSNTFYTATGKMEQSTGEVAQTPSASSPPSNTFHTPTSKVASIAASEGQGDELVPPVTSTPEVAKSSSPFSSSSGYRIDTLEFEHSDEGPQPRHRASTPELEESQESVASRGSLGDHKPSRNDDSIFEELSAHNTDMIAEVDFGADITGPDTKQLVMLYLKRKRGRDNEGVEEDEDKDKDNDADSVSDNFFGMGKELENLILENTELLATKNALNIVKDDLIAKVDELTSEQEILREEITSLQTVKGRLQQRLTQLEEELKKTKEEIASKNQASKEEEEDDVPMAQRKRFTRVEMARVLMERNQYKERLMELQEAVRWTEMIRASREHPAELGTTKKKSSVWNFFSNLLGSKPKAEPAAIAPSISSSYPHMLPNTTSPPSSSSISTEGKGVHHL